MTKAEVLQYLDGVNGKTIKLGLGPITALMEAVNWPDRGQKIIHITGTNGKGSVCEMTSQILQAGGYRVGTFNSPYFEVHNECIRINNQMISDEDLLRLMNEIEPSLKTLEKQEVKLSGFEILTVLALLYFKERQVDFVILEVGLGGRLDATNVIENSVLIILTKIALDHQNFLGNSIEEIAKEKAGIIKTNGLVLMPDQESNIMKVIKAQCKEKNACLKTIRIKEPSLEGAQESEVQETQPKGIESNGIKLEGLELEEIKSIRIDSKRIQSIKLDESGIEFRYKEKSYKLNMLGKYQVYNAILAIEAVELLNQHQGLEVSDQQIKIGLEHAKWAGRFEKVRQQPLCFVDGAHNVDGIKALVDTLKLLPKRKTIAIIGMLRDKEIDEMLKEIMPYIDVCIVTKPLNPRAEEVEVLADKIKGYMGEVYIREQVEEAYDLALELARKIKRQVEMQTLIEHPQTSNIKQLTQAIIPARVQESIGEEVVQIIGFGSLYMIGKLRCIMKREVRE
ncbi:MAG: bifunctional folylpolyglutamate synthase/dihydrofolate synthase [Cellulosilyticum sp.]|nr:bifunctional folylpolyglutamate synthase/dihydrofolate synthase [Cellulosilyticum sp.]